MSADDADLADEIQNAFLRHSVVGAACAACLSPQKYLMSADDADGADEIQIPSSDNYVRQPLRPRHYLRHLRDLRLKKKRRSRTPSAAPAANRGQGIICVICVICG